LSQPAAVPSTDTLRRDALEASRRGARALAALQREDGHWPGDYGGPLFLLPGLLIACHVTGVRRSEHERERMVTYLTNIQNEDGGFGLHVESPSYVLGTALNYAALRLLGVPADDERAARARTWLHERGGAAGIPTWGKIWLSVLGCYEWDGVMPVPPELWLLPRALPLHPGRLWCHTRAIHLPVSYLYGRRFRPPVTDLTRALRRELFLDPYEEIDWSSLRERVHPGDVTSPHSPLLRSINRVLAAYERRPNRVLREKALAFVLDQIRHEDATTGFLDIGPVSKALHVVCAWDADPTSEAFQKHVARIDDYLWDGRDGMKMQGYNGSQFWDTAFAAHALVETGLAGEMKDVLAKANRFIDANQVREDIDQHDRYFRDRTRGAFPFSTAEQAWTVSDCTAKGVTAALLLGPHVPNPLSRERLAEAIDLLLRDQNHDGGWSEYERARGGAWLERLNAAEVFGRIMIAYSYVETTSACMQALAAFAARWPDYRRADIDQAMRRAKAYVLSKQRSDGGFYGSWGVCFTYGTWFAIEGLRAAGEGPRSPAIRRACAFLLGKQNADGGWGESYRACVEERWVDHPEGSQVVHTAWALLGLMAAAEADHDAVERGVRLLIARQEADGDWPEEGITGVFNRTCMIHYDNYRHIMPLWALGRYARSGATP
jgi:squalene/oxidosqualene cyclase-like protein